MILRAFDVLHPEVILNRRGDIPLRATYKRWFDASRFEMHPNGILRMSVNDDFLIEKVNVDNNLARMIRIAKTFVDRKGRVYALGKSIMRALTEVDTAIPLTALPERWIGYVVFPPKTITDGTDFYQGAYVWTDTTAMMGMKPERVAEHNRSVCVVAVADNLNYYCTLTDFIDSKNLKTLAQDVTTDATTSDMVDDIKSLEQVYRAAVSAALFINSDEPDLRDAKPMPVNMSQTAAKKTGRDFIEAITVPVTLVDWSWVPSSPDYTKNLWYRKAHWSTRWTGPGRTIPRAVFVKGHWNERRQGGEEE